MTPTQPSMVGACPPQGSKNSRRGCPDEGATRQEDWSLCLPQTLGARLQIHKYIYKFLIHQ